MKLEEEKSLNSELMKKVKYLEYLNSSLTQTNKLLLNKLAILTKKYNSLKNELFDTECHINFCKQNLSELISFQKEEGKEKTDKNFIIFKSKIKTLFEYGDEFMKINSDIAIYDIVIENIKSIKDENIILNKNMNDLKKLIHQNYEYNNDFENVQSQKILFNNNKVNDYETYSKKNNHFSDNSDIDDNLLIYNNNCSDFNY